MQASTCRLRRLTRLVTVLFVIAGSSPARGQDRSSGVIGDFPEVAFPPGNPSTPEKIELGRALFFEEQLSTDDTMACATCHLPATGGADPRAGAPAPGLDKVLGTFDDEFGSPGVISQDAVGRYAHHPQFGVARQATERNAPSVIGAAFFSHLFWDVRAGPRFLDERGKVVLHENAALESLAVDPPLSSVEMGHLGNDWASVIAKLETVRPLALASDLPPALAAFLGQADRYGPLFTQAFGTPEITRERVAMAIATYERTLVADQTPFDLGTMTPEQQAGFGVFLEPGSFCAFCHRLETGIFSDGRLNTVLLPGHIRFVKTPSLRNVGLRRRFMSSGQFKSLKEVLQHYRKSLFLGPVLPKEKNQLIAFLGEALTDPRVAAELPPFDRPTLRSELEPFGANLFGAGGPGSGGVEPVMIAATPALAGGREAKVGIGDGAPGARAVLLLSTDLNSSVRGLRAGFLLVDRDAARAYPVTLGPDGVATLPLNLSASLVGAELFAQWIVLDPGVPGGLSWTRGAVLSVF